MDLTPKMFKVFYFCYMIIFHMIPELKYLTNLVEIKLSGNNISEEETEKIRQMFPGIALDI